MKITLLLTVLLTSLYYSSQAQVIAMTIEGIRSNKGVVSLGIFKTQEQFAKEKPIQQQIFAKSTLKAGVLKLEFKLEPGNYGIALLDDENKDGLMNYNWLGIPLEGFGFSNYSSSGLSRPNYSNFSFVVKPGENKVSIKMRYM